MSRHAPVLPLWTCAECDLPWPCTARRHELRIEFADKPVALGLYLGSSLVAATQDLHWVPAETLHRRFLGWIRSA